MHRGARLSALGFLIATVALGIEATSAFNYTFNGGRGVASLIATDAASYTSFSLSSSCTAIPFLLGGTCTITHQNKGTASVRFWTNETADSCAIATTASGNSGAALVPVGGSWAFAVTITARLTGGACNVFYNVAADNPNHLFHADINGFKVTIIYV